MDKLSHICYLRANCHSLLAVPSFCNIALQFIFTFTMRPSIALQCTVPEVKDLFHCRETDCNTCKSCQRGEEPLRIKEISKKIETKLRTLI